MTNERHNVIIIGGGPSGLSAALYNARASLKPLVFAGSPPGGQLTLTTEVENFPGVPSIMGPELVQTMRSQAKTFNAEIIDRNISHIEKDDNGFKVVTAGNPPETYVTKTIILATGAKALWLGLENEQRLMGKGVSACATCDGFFFRGKTVAVIGGGDTAMEDTLTLTKFAEKVYVVHRREEFRASKIMQERVLNNKKVEVIWNTKVADVLGEDRLEQIQLESTKDGSQRMLDIDGMFVAIGHKPDTDFVKDIVALDSKGYIRTSQTVALDAISAGTVTDITDTFSMEYPTMTSVKGIFAAGDCVDHLYRQASTSAGMGVAASLDVERYLIANE